MTINLILFILLHPSKINKVTVALKYYKCIFTVSQPNRVAHTHARTHTHTNLGGIFRAFLLEVVKLHDFGHDEAFLEVCVDLSRCLGGLGSFLLGNKGGRRGKYQRATPGLGTESPICTDSLLYT